MMKAMQLPKMSTRKSNCTYAASDIECPNHLKQKFYPEEPNQVWAGDITYLRVGSTWFYLCVIIHLFSRKVISWKISGNNNVDLTIATFKSAFEESAFLFWSSKFVMT
ncbi:MAG: DDE-type integrase/transposase/recombinase [Clostridiales bacterium]|nr:DDE-type integrase/transposase/recombinase [Clostridiales bacterium]